MEASNKMTSVRRWLVLRREVATATGRSAVGRGDEDLLQRFELLKAHPAAERDAVEWVRGDDDRHVRLGLEAVVEPVQQGSAARQHDALLHDVRGELRRRPVEGHLDGVDDRRDRLLDRAADLLGRRDDGLRQAGDEVATADLRVQLLLELAG